MSSDEEDCVSLNCEELAIYVPPNALNEVFNKDIRPLIDLIDQLRRFGIQQDIQLPNVVVVGDQSSGKSSIIEALSGVELPRGKGIVTRCPLELQLKRVFNRSWRAKISYRAKTGNIEEFDIDEPSEVGDYVRTAQIAICGKGNSVSSELITLRIESPEETAPDLTVIDLPGITRIALADQASDHCEIIRNMIMKHVKSNKTVMLCIISANLDIAVNESVKIARTVDPQGERTIGVLTKPDAVDESNKEDVLCVLNNEKIKLVKGFVMVKCRTQRELDDCISLKDSLQNEKEFFETDRIYKQANRSQLGIMNLAKKISEELVNIIKKSIPELKSQVEEALMKAQSELDRLSEPIPTDDIEKRSYLAKMLWSLCSLITANLSEGKSADKTDNYYYFWRDYFTKFLKAIEDKKTAVLRGKFSASNLKEIILKARGRELLGFLNYDVFKDLVPKHLVSYESDAEQLLKLMKENVERNLNKILQNKLGHLPEIERDVKEIIHKEIFKYQKEASDKINFLFKQEAIIFTMDVTFRKEMEALKQQKIKEENARNRNAPSGLSLMSFQDDRDTNSEEMHDMIKIYLDIVNHRLSDVIPLTIMQCLLLDLSKSLENQLIFASSSDEMVKKVQENKVLSEKRRQITDKIKRLQLANSALIRF